MRAQAHMHIHTLPGTNMHQHMFVQCMCMHTQTHTFHTSPFPCPFPTSPTSGLRHQLPCDQLSDWANVQTQTGGLCHPCESTDAKVAGVVLGYLCENTSAQDCVFRDSHFSSVLVEWLFQSVSSHKLLIGWLVLLSCHFFFSLWKRLIRRLVRWKSLLTLEHVSVRRSFWRMWAETHTTRSLSHHHFTLSPIPSLPPNPPSLHSYPCPPTLLPFTHPSPSLPPFTLTLLPLPPTENPVHLWPLPPPSLHLFTPLQF